MKELFDIAMAMTGLGVAVLVRSALAEKTARSGARRQRAPGTASLEASVVGRELHRRSTHDLEKAEDALAVSEGRLRGLVENVPGMFTVCGPRGELEYANRHVLDFVGKELRELKEAWVGILHPDDAEGVASEWRRCVAAKEPLHVVHRIRRADGVYRWIDAEAHPLFDEQGAIAQWYVLLVDIDACKEAELAREESDAQLHLLMETIPAMVSRTGADGSLTYANQHVLDYTGGSLEAERTTGFSRFVHPDDLALVIQGWFHAVNTVTPYNLVYRLRRFDGVYRWAYGRAEPLRAKDGRVLSWFCFTLDIDEAKKTEMALESTQARLSRALQIATVAQLSTSIAREMNEPLRRIVADGELCLDALSQSSLNVEKARSLAGRIVRHGTAAADVVRRTRALFEQAAVPKTSVDLNSVVAEVCSLMAGELDRNQVLVETELRENLPSIVADRTQMQQVVVNLVQNAIDAMEQTLDRARVIRVRTEVREGCVVVEVRDHGSGIFDPEAAFAPFFTAERKSVGMGLAIAGSIIRAHDGRFWAANNDDRGASFGFEIPLPGAAPC